MSILENTKDKINGGIDLALSNATAKVYEGYYKRWMGICEVDSIDKIDWKNPQVEIESKLCDIRNLMMIRNGEHTADFLQLLSTDEARILYYEKDEDGNSYASMMENPKYLRAFGRELLKHITLPSLRRRIKAWCNSD